MQRDPFYPSNTQNSLKPTNVTATLSGISILCLDKEMKIFSSISSICLEFQVLEVDYFLILNGSVIFKRAALEAGEICHIRSTGVQIPRSYVKTEWVWQTPIILALGGRDRGFPRASKLHRPFRTDKLWVQRETQTQ